MQTINAIAYSYDMLSFVFQNIESGNKINSIYLYGSAVRGELTKKSDIDLFFDCGNKDEDYVKRLSDSGIVKFFSSNDYKKWKLLHFTYPFSVMSGDLKEWDLKLSIASEGILLYSNNSALDLGKRQVLFKIEYPKKKNEYIRVRRILFGRDEKDYKGTGLIKQINGKKISSDVFITPQHHLAKVRDVLNKEKIEYSFKEICVFE